MYNTRKKNQPGFYQQLIKGNLYEEVNQTKIIYLKNMFQFGTKFMESNEFLSKYNLEKERCENQRYYCTASNFEFKLIKGRKLKFNQRDEGKVISRQIMSNPTFCVSFFVKKFP